MNKTEELINLDTLDGIVLENHVDYSSLTELLLYVKYSLNYKNVEELRFTPRIRNQKTLEELRNGFYMELDDTFHEAIMKDYTPTESEFMKMLEKEKSEENRLEYKLEYIIQGEIDEGVSPPAALGQEIIDRFKSMSSDGKINVILEGRKYQVPVTISDGIILGDKKLEKLVLGRPEEL